VEPVYQSSQRHRRQSEIEDLGSPTRSAVVGLAQPSGHQPTAHAYCDGQGPSSGADLP